MIAIVLFLISSAVAITQNQFLSVQRAQALAESADRAQQPLAFLQRLAQQQQQEQQEQQQEQQQREVPREQQLQAMAHVLIALQHSIARGSAFYNAGQPTACANLYYQTCVQLAQVLQAMGEQQASTFMLETTKAALATADVRTAAWTMRKNMDLLYRSIVNSDKYSVLVRPESYDQEEQFVAEMIGSLAQFFSQAMEQVQKEPNAGCGYGLTVIESENGVELVAVRALEGCDDELDSSDAFFFVEMLSKDQEAEEGEEEEECSEGTYYEQVDYQVDYSDKQSVDELAESSDSSTDTVLVAQANKAVADSQELAEMRYEFEEYANGNLDGPSDDGVQVYVLDGGSSSDDDTIVLNGKLDIRPRISNNNNIDHNIEKNNINKNNKHNSFKIVDLVPANSSHDYKSKPMSKKRHHKCALLVLFVALFGLLCAVMVRARRQQRRRNAARKGLRIVYGVQPPTNAYPFAMNATTV